MDDRNKHYEIRKEGRRGLVDIEVCRDSKNIPERAKKEWLKHPRTAISTELTEKDKQKNNNKNLESRKEKINNCTYMSSDKLKKLHASWQGHSEEGLVWLLNGISFNAKVIPVEE